MPKSVECEVLTSKGWSTVNVEEYLALHETGGRCLECKEPIRAHKQSITAWLRISSTSSPILPVPWPITALDVSRFIAKTLSVVQ